MSGRIRTLDLITKAIENRTIDHPDDDKVKKYEAGKYNPSFAFVVRDCELKCVWVGNLKREKGELAEIDICRCGNSSLKKGRTAKQWDELVFRIHPFVQELTDQLEGIA